MLTSTALVLMMTIAGLALFYGGMVRKKNVLSTVMQSFAITCLMSILWMVAGYSLAFTDGGSLNSYIGGLSKAFFSGVTMESLTGTIPEYVFITFQMTFAVITPALIAGSFAERMKFSSMLVFLTLWLFIVYIPVAHWVWGGGFMASDGVLDFAGGTVVHINAGVAGLVAALIIGKRDGYGHTNMAPHNLVLSVIGAALLWVGWFGFNAGSAVGANALAGVAMLRLPVRLWPGCSWNGRLQASRACSVSFQAPLPALLPLRLPPVSSTPWVRSSSASWLVRFAMWRP
jgi:Amt family ammonium transporter